MILFLCLVIFGTMIAYGCIKAAQSADDPEAAETGDKSGKRIVKTMIVGENSRRSAKSGVVRGAVGGALLGPVGMLAGVGSAKRKGKTTFLVQYSDGTRNTVTVKTGGVLFKSYVQYLEM